VSLAVHPVPELEKLPLRPLVCDQLPGETFYVPEGWQHAVVNMEISVGLAIKVGSDVAGGDRGTAML
jgi:hypothetical protein